MIKIPELLGFATLLLSGAAHASTFSCASSILNYNFSLSGTIQGNKVIGSTVISVTQNGKPLRRAALPVSSSQFAPSQALILNAADPTSKVTLSSHFQNGVYVGPMSIQSTEGNVNLTATCSIQ